MAESHRSPDRRKPPLTPSSRRLSDRLEEAWAAYSLKPSADTYAVLHAAIAGHDPLAERIRELVALLRHLDSARERGEPSWDLERTVREARAAAHAALRGG